MISPFSSSLPEPPVHRSIGALPIRPLSALAMTARHPRMNFSSFKYIQFKLWARLPPPPSISLSVMETIDAFISFLVQSKTQGHGEEVLQVASGEIKTIHQDLSGCCPRFSNAENCLLWTTHVQIQVSLQSRDFFLSTLEVFPLFLCWFPLLEYAYCSALFVFLFLAARHWP